MKSKQEKDQVNEYVEQISEQNPEAMVMDNYDNCIVGIARRCGMEPVLCYSVTALMNEYINVEGMTPEEAMEHFEYNVVGGWVGEGTPIFIEENMA